MLYGWFYLRKSVKDSDNLITHNIWSGGDYSKSTVGFSSGVGEISVSNEKSTKGDNSIKIVEGNAYFKYDVNPADVGKTLEITTDIYNPTSSTVQMYIYATKFGASNSSMKWLTVEQSSTGFQSISSTQLVIPDYTTVTCVFTMSNTNTGDTIYVDNISLSIQ